MTPPLQIKVSQDAQAQIEEAMRYELVVNLKTARALGVKISQSVLIRADRVIE